jgi:hypothetical protein
VLALHFPMRLEMPMCGQQGPYTMDPHPLANRYTVTVSMPRGAPVQGTPRDLQVAHGRLGLGGLQDDVTRFS